MNVKELDAAALAAQIASAAESAIANVRRVAEEAAEAVAHAARGLTAMPQSSHDWLQRAQGVFITEVELAEYEQTIVVRGVEIGKLPGAGRVLFGDPPRERVRVVMLVEKLPAVGAERREP